MPLIDAFSCQKVRHTVFVRLLMLSPADIDISSFTLFRYMLFFFFFSQDAYLPDIFAMLMPCLMFSPWLAFRFQMLPSPDYAAAFIDVLPLLPPYR